MPPCRPRRAWMRALTIAACGLALGVARGAEAPSVPPERPSNAQPPTLRCQVRYMSDTQTLSTTPVADPYTVAAHDIGRFRFKAVMVGQGAHVEHIALYAYDTEVADVPVLIHEVVLQPPFALGTRAASLTGWNHVYSSRLGRELVYGCRLDTGAT